MARQLTGVLGDYTAGFPRRLSLPELRAHPAWDRNLEGYLRRIDRELNPHLRRVAERLPNVPVFREGTVRQIRSGGKRLRAALSIAACEMFCSEPLRALDFAAAIELLQNFTLVHDDCIDGDEKRRSQPTLWIQYGLGHAITIGDAFIALASLAILDAGYPEPIKARLMRAIATFGLEMAAGQSMDINLKDADRPTMHDYIACTRRKTGAFLAMVMVGGGIIGNASDDELEQLAGFGALAGVAFQIKDDLLDVIGSKGRDVGSDVQEGKITPLAIHALAKASPAEATRLREILRKDFRATGPVEVSWTIDLYRSTGALDFAEALSERISRAAAKRLLALGQSEARDRLLLLARYLSRRMH